LVTRLGEITLGLEEALLGKQNIDDGAGADFEAGIRGLEGRLGRHERLLARLNFAHAGDDGAEGIFCLANDQALGLIEGLVSGPQAGARLAALGLRGKALEDWNVELQTQAPSVDGQFGRSQRLLGGRITTDEFVVDVARVAAGEGQGRQVPGTGNAQIGLGRRQLTQLLQNDGAGFQGDRDPVLRGGRLGNRQRKVFEQAGVFLE
jgi:hypothetical protein